MAQRMIKLELRELVVRTSRVAQEVRQPKDISRRQGSWTIVCTGMYVSDMFATMSMYVLV